MFMVATEGRDDGMTAGAKAETEATRRAATNVFMFAKQSGGIGLSRYLGAVADLMASPELPRQ